MLNIFSDPLKVHKKTNRTHFSTAEKWAERKRESKRKAAFEPQESSASKQRKINQTGQQHTHKQKLQTPRSPSQRSNNRDTEENGDQRENSAAKSPSKVKTFPKKAPEEQRDHGRPFIKTSSLFRNNPEIPDVLSPAINQVKEKVFTSNTFEELDLHPHLVATLHKVLNVTSMTRLRKGINVLISTPGRLVDHIKNTLSIAFSAVRWLILDEADRILDLGFEKDLTVILNAMNATGPARQNVLLSATLTEGLSRLASISMKEPVSIHVSEGSEETVEACPQAGPQALSDSYAVPERLQQHVVVVPSKLHLVCLAAFILAKCKFEQRQKLIVFISSCEAVEFLLTLLTAVLCEKPSTTSTKHTSASLNFYRLHGNMRQEERTEVFQEFSQCKTGVLLCTDVAARGLDLPQVTWIVQYNPPVSAAEYVHRVGRTARIGAQGSSLLFLTPSETAFVDVLANHNISLSEMKMEDILATLMKDERFKGRGKWDGKRSAAAFEQEVRVRATVLQTDFENYVHANNESLQTAKSALQSFLRAYTAYPSSLKHIFHIRSLHLGHAAKSFGLRDAPQGLGSSITTNPANSKDSKKGKDKAKRLDQFIAACVAVSLQGEMLGLRHPGDRAGGFSEPEAAEPVVEARTVLCTDTTLVPGRG
ncbi:putative ATP-dependent RNA helicase DDX31 isoform X1 [Labeo rohita]|uniref:ATP-dependent RNA helicase n=1 Tax=Labeo rohita TaxID=84645 RepID=A0A498LRR7_LABRO|nr:putative ATP-dependent RNA helicase DDX31 isoform X1 [Labeo rohita]